MTEAGTSCYLSSIYFNTLSILSFYILLLEGELHGLGGDQRGDRGAGGARELHAVAPGAGEAAQQGQQVGCNGVNNATGKEIQKITKYFWMRIVRLLFIFIFSYYIQEPACCHRYIRSDVPSDFRGRFFPSPPGCRRGLFPPPLRGCLPPTPRLAPPTPSRPDFPPPPGTHLPPTLLWPQLPEGGLLPSGETSLKKNLLEELK